MPEAAATPLARAFSTLLWDLKCAVGWSARSPEECVRAADADQTIRTALLDARFLSGEAATCELFSRGVLPKLLTHRADAYIQEKAQELRARREKFGDSVFLLEPNIKQGEGGLRDLETALWIARVRFHTRGLTGLLQQSLLPESEVARLKAARDFLLRIRHHLHLLRGRKEDRLTFDLQEIASAAHERCVGKPEVAGGEPSGLQDPRQGLGEGACHLAARHVPRLVR